MDVQAASETRSHFRRELVLCLAAATLGTALFSHAVARIAGLRVTAVSEARVQSHRTGEPVLVLGSSLTEFGLSLLQIARQFDAPVTSLTVPNGSSSELETVAAAERPSATIIGISIFDQNENTLSDFRGNLVPLTTTLSDLRESASDLRLSKRILSVYPLTWLRLAFPTAGRSTAILVAAREGVQKLSSRSQQADSTPERLTLDSNRREPANRADCRLVRGTDSSESLPAPQLGDVDNLVSRSEATGARTSCEESRQYGGSVGGCATDFTRCTRESYPS